MFKLKDNMVLIAGIALPLILVAFFILASVIPRLSVAQPEYDVIFTNNGNHWNYNSYAREYISGTTTFRREDGRIRARFQAFDEPRERTPSRLFRYNAATDTVTEIPIILPPEAENLEADEHIIFDIPALENIEISLSQHAPDGYEFISNHRRNRGLMGELFSTGNSTRGAYLIHNGRMVELPRETVYSSFMGWVISDETSQIVVEESNEGDTP